MRRREVIDVVGLRDLRYQSEVAVLGTMGECVSPVVVLIR